MTHQDILGSPITNKFQTVGWEVAVLTESKPKSTETIASTSVHEQNFGASD